MTHTEVISALHTLLAVEAQEEFNATIGQLDRVLSELVLYAKSKHTPLDLANKQTLKHHAEDMIAAGEKILSVLGKGVEGTPQPEL